MNEAVESGAPLSSVRVWDVPVRVVHWALAGLLGFSWYSAETGQMDCHRWSGYAVTGLLVFRLIWGFAGSSTARFSNFVRGPAAVRAAISTLWDRRPGGGIGHNPLGAWSVVALLVTLAVQIVTGLFTVDVDGIESGPLSDRVSFDQGREIAALHDLSFTILQALALLHVAAILFYTVYKRDNLITAMITGKRRVPVVSSDTTAAFEPAGAIRLILSAAIAVLAMWLVSKGLRF